MSDSVLPATDATTIIPPAQTPQLAEVPGAARASLLDKPLAAFTTWRWEHVLWVTLLLVSFALRMYDLGVRAMSHDESLHTLYAYYLYNEGRYEHNPMMHGPLRYHLTALVYFLFGANDFTSRLMPALFGSGLIALMYAFRRYIGRTGAFLAALLLAVSPSLLFHSRYIRDDIFIATFTALWAYFAFRYLETRRARWLALMALTMGFSFATMENSFITGAVFGAFFVMYALWHAVRARLFVIIPPFIPFGAVAYYYHYMDRDDIALPVLGVGVLLTLGLGVYSLMRTEGAWTRFRTSFAADIAVLMLTLVMPFLSPFLHVALGGDPTVFMDAGYQTGDLVMRMAILTAVTTALGVAIAYAWFAIIRKPDDEGRIGFMDWAQMMAGFWTINILFFTTFFTNTRNGLATGVVGSLGYWLAQQEVERGNQPWYYYGFIGSLYEFLPIILTIGAGVTLAWGIFGGRGFEAVATSDLPADDPTVHLPAAPHIRNAFIALLAVWTGGMWAGYTVAGEKMPWLLTHMALPMCIFGAWWLGRLLHGVDWQRALRTRAVWLIALVPAIVLMAIIFVRSVPAGSRTIDAVAGWMRFVLAGAALAALVYFATLWVRAAGVRLAGVLIAVGIFASLFVLNARASFMLNYVNYDMATEYLVYAHASPDVKRAFAEIDAISARTVGDRNIVVAYDDESSWPLSWYFREYPNARYYGDNPDSNAMSAPIIIVGNKNREKVVPYVERDYAKRTYRRIWWPDMDYFNLTAERIWYAFTNPQQRERLWQIALFRRHRDTNDFSKFRDLMQWPAREEFDMWVRKDLATQIWDLNVTPSLFAQEQNPLLAVAQVDAAASTIITGSFDGVPLLTPRDVAVAPNGNRVIADTGNHRIVVTDALGEEVLTFGSFCDISQANEAPCVDPDGAGALVAGDGQFNEPWGVAVDNEGRIFVSDTWNGRIQVFDADGRFLRKWGFFNTTSGELGDANALFGPRGIAVDLDGNLLVADTGNKRIVRYTAEGALVDQMGGGGVIAGRFDEPTDVAIDPSDGSIYVADAWNRRIQKFDANLAFIQEFAVPGWESREIYHKPSITVLANGDVYATDPQFYRVFIYDRAGALRATFGRYGVDANQFGLPNGIAADLPNTSVVIADADNARVMVIPNVE